MKRLILIATLLSACQAELPEPPVVSAETPRTVHVVPSGVESFRCAGDIGDGITVYTRGAIWPDGTTYQYLELGLYQDISVRADLGQLVDGRNTPQYLTVGGLYWSVVYDRRDLSETNHGTLHIRMVDRDWGYTVGGLCAPGAADPHPDRVRTL